METFAQYTYEDFFTNSPYETVYRYSDNPMLHEVAIATMNDRASSCGIKGFRKAYQKYFKVQQNMVLTRQVNNVTQFSDQPIVLNAGDWETSDNGIIRRNGNMKILACSHPILPVERLTNIDTRTEKLRIAFKRGNRWREIIVERQTVASPGLILSLANHGVAVTSDNAANLVKYLHDLETLNYSQIPEKLCVSRLGWIDKANFSPYVENLVFDGESSYHNFFESVQTHGSRDVWMDLIREIRRGSIYARIALASSLASILVKPLGGLTFFIHLWGVTEVGKTVALMVAASVIADPEVGKYIHSFNSTAVGREKSAAFVNNLPLILDELQVAKENGRSKFDQDVYALSEGAGKTRGTKQGGVDKGASWASCILTSGEEPITHANSGGGAVNRILEIECKEKIFDEPNRVANTIKQNYGFIGREFVEALNQVGQLEKARAIFQQNMSALIATNATEKQSMAAAIILTADELATEWIYQDGCQLALEEIKPFLHSKDVVSANRRGYESLCQWVIQNRHRFGQSSSEREVWGSIESGSVNIINQIFEEAVRDLHLHPKAFRSWLKSETLIQIRDDGRGTSVTRRINGIPTDCISLKIEGLTPDDACEPAMVWTDFHQLAEQASDSTPFNLDF